VPTPSCVHVLTPSCVHNLTPSCVHKLTPSCVHVPTPSCVHVLTPSCVVHVLTCSHCHVCMCLHPPLYTGTGKTALVRALLQSADNWMTSEDQDLIVEMDYKSRKEEPPPQQQQQQQQRAQSDALRKSAAGQTLLQGACVGCEGGGCNQVCPCGCVCVYFVRGREWERDIYLCACGCALCLGCPQRPSV